MTKPESALDALHTEEKEAGLTFPCVFPIKVMGRTQDGFAQAVADVVRKHAADFDPAALEMRTSKEGNWLSFTATVDLDDRDAVVAQHMLAPAGEAERVDRRMLGQPDFVGRFRVALRREILHGLPGGHVVGGAERANDEAGGPVNHDVVTRHNTIFTIGCATSSR